MSHCGSARGSGTGRRRRVSVRGPCRRRARQRARPGRRSWCRSSCRWRRSTIVVAAPKGLDEGVPRALGDEVAEPRVAGHLGPAAPLTAARRLSWPFGVEHRYSRTGSAAEPPWTRPLPVTAAVTMWARRLLPGSSHPPAGDHPKSVISSVDVPQAPALVLLPTMYGLSAPYPWNQVARPPGRQGVPRSRSVDQTSGRAVGGIATGSAVDR